jgi:hypothetical protein
MPAALKRFACRRAAGRAWKFARRNQGAGHLSRWFGRELRARLGLTGDPIAFIEGCAQAFERAPSPGAPSHR